jgi:hypothetical protein
MDVSEEKEQAVPTPATNIVDGEQVVCPGIFKAFC